MERNETGLWIFNESPTGERFFVGTELLPSDISALRLEARHEMTPMTFGSPAYARSIAMLNNYLEMDRIEMPISMPPEGDLVRAKMGVVGILHVATSELPPEFTGMVVVRSEYEVVQDVMRLLGANRDGNAYFMGVRALDSRLGSRFPYTMHSYKYRGAR